MLVACGVFVAVGVKVGAITPPGTEGAIVFVIVGVGVFVLVGVGVGTFCFGVDVKVGVLLAT